MLMVVAEPAEPCRADRNARNVGFTLVEVLVALAVLSLCLTVVISTLSGGLFQQRRGQTLAEATLGAQSLLARIGVDIPLNPGTVDGTFPNGLEWQVRIAPYGDGGDREAWPVAAYTATVQVFGPASKEPALQLTTIRLGPKSQP